MAEQAEHVQDGALFRGLTEQERKQALLCLQGTVREYVRKEVIFPADARLDAVGLVLSGHALLCKENAEGSRFIFSELGRGELIGETALRSDREPGGYEAVAGSDCVILFVQIGNILRPGLTVCPLRARILENILTLLLENNRSVYQKLDLVSHRSLRDRILHYLQLQARKNRSPHFTIPFSRSDLADYLTVDRSALSRELTRMAEDNLITFSGNAFHLLAALPLPPVAKNLRPLVKRVPVSVHAPTPIKPKKQPEETPAARNR